MQKDKYIKMTCDFCRKEFWKLKSVQKESNRRGTKNFFCSKECAYKFKTWKVEMYGSKKLPYEQDRYKWTRSALECYLLKSNCENCSTFKYISAGCFMYKTLEKIIEKNGLPTQEIIDNMYKENKGENDEH